MQPKSEWAHLEFIIYFFIALLEAFVVPLILKMRHEHLMELLAKSWENFKTFLNLESANVTDEKIETFLCDLLTFPSLFLFLEIISKGP